MLKKILAVSILLILVSCGIQKKGDSDNVYSASDMEPYPSYQNQVMEILVKENVREWPNGEIIGETKKNEKFTIVERKGNWLKVENEDFSDGYIWAPSFLILKIDLYALSTWYDLEEERFFSVKQFNNLLGSDPQIADHFGLERLNFYDIGLGEEKTIEMDQTGKSEEILQKRGFAIILGNSGNVAEVLLDLKKPLTDFRKLSELLQIELNEPDIVDQTQIVWNNAFGLKEIVLLREEFNTEKYNQIALIK